EPSAEEEQTYGLEGAELGRLIQAHEAKLYSDFESFLREVIPSLESKKASADALKYVAGLKLDLPSDELFRLLGVYTRIHYKTRLLTLLSELVAIPTYKRDDLPQHHNPAIIRLGAKLQEISRDFGLKF